MKRRTEMRRWRIFARLALALALVATVIAAWRRASVAQRIVERPLALASGDFDEDGMPDLLSGYANGDAGVIKWRRGNIAAVYPGARDTTSAERETTVAPFHNTEGVTALTVAP